MKKLVIILGLVSLFLAGCNSLKVKDINNQPLSGVKFSTDTKYDSRKENENNPYNLVVKQKDDSHFEAISNDLGEIDLQGYSFKEGKLSKDNYLSLYNIKENGEYTLYKVDDYFTDDFLIKDEYKELKNKIGKFIVNIEATAYYYNAIIDLKRIDLFTFKNNNYISIYFNSINVYNNLKVDKYQVGKNLYAELVVKILDYLILIEDDKINGVNININGYSKNFLDEHGHPTPIRFSFIINKDTIKKFKDKDITSQKLLDESVILMDNERIELKLQ